MDSDTLVASSPPGKPCIDHAAIQRCVLREDVRCLLSPALNVKTRFVLPVGWQTTFMAGIGGPFRCERYLLCPQEVTDWLFPPLLPDTHTYTMGTALKGDDVVFRGIKWWFAVFHLGRAVFRVNRPNRLRYIRALVKRYVKMLSDQNESRFVHVVMDNSPFDETLVAHYQNTFRQYPNDTGGVPVFRLLLMDSDLPIVMMWQDEENLVSFSLEKLGHYDFYAQARFVATLQTFLEQACEMANVTILQLPLGNF